MPYSARPTTQHAFDATVKVIDAIAANLQTTVVVHQGDLVASFDPPWGDPVDVIATQDVSMIYWPGMAMRSSIDFDDVKAPLKAGDQVGTLNVQPRRAAAGVAHRARTTAERGLLRGVSPASGTARSRPVTGQGSLSKLSVARR